jgi:hypothetical protein
MFGWLTNTMAPEPITLDHVPVNGTPSDQPEPKATAPGEGLSHEQKLKLAAQRAGKPFRCAPDGLPREVIKNGSAVTVGVKPFPVPEPPPNVTSLSRKARA